MIISLARERLDNQNQGLEAMKWVTKSADQWNEIMEVMWMVMTNQRTTNSIKIKCQSLVVQKKICVIELRKAVRDSSNWSLMLTPVF